MADIYDEEDRKSALIQGLLGAAFPLLGARRGSEFNAFGQAGLLGLNSYNRSLEGAAEARDRKAEREMKQQEYAQRQQEYALKMQQMQQQQAQQAAMQRAAGGAFVGGSPGMPAQEADNPGGTYMPPTAPQPGRFDPQAYIAALQQQGLPQQAIAAAEKYAPKEKKLKDTRTLMQNGKRITVNMYDDGTHEVLPYAPDAEKLHFGSTGTNALVGADPFSGAVVSPGVPMGMSPADSARIGIDRQRLGLEQQRFNREGASGAGDKWVNDLDRGVQISMATGDTRPITAGGQPVGTKKDTKLVDGSQRALTVLDMAEGIIKNGDPTGSLAGNLYDTALGAFGKATEGAKSVAGLQALEGSLMMAQPRMEGPQSDRDTALYKQMAGKIGDPNIPNGIKLAAIKVIRDMHRKYSANAGAPAAVEQKPQRQVVRTGTRNGRKVVQYADGTIEEQ